VFARGHQPELVDDEEFCMVCPAPTTAMLPIPSATVLLLCRPLLSCYSTLLQPHYCHTAATVLLLHTALLLLYCWSSTLLQPHYCYRTTVTLLLLLCCCYILHCRYCTVALYCCDHTTATAPLPHWCYGTTITALSLLYCCHHITATTLLLPHHYPTVVLLLPHCHYCTVATTLL
jgi:hypothetical protein